jgi:hypothetical protein
MMSPRACGGHWRKTVYCLLFRAGAFSLRYFGSFQVDYVRSPRPDICMGVAPFSAISTCFLSNSGSGNIQTLILICSVSPLRHPHSDPWPPNLHYIFASALTPGSPSSRAPKDLCPTTSPAWTKIASRDKVPPIGRNFSAPPPRSPQEPLRPWLCTPRHRRHTRSAPAPLHRWRACHVMFVVATSRRHVLAWSLLSVRVDIRGRQHLPLCMHPSRPHRRRCPAESTHPGLTLASGWE